ncbi:hypothetical protein H6F61_21620 [Cyanobacteria bacterium FACHB-472]|nr:hypothetical protein [Cyanobacteria bacterium FACHB-472]
MLVSKILYALPASLEWMVLFSLSAVRPLAEDTIVRQMFFLPKEVELDFYSHVILTSHGRFLAPNEGLGLINPSNNHIWSIADTDTSLRGRFSRQLSLFPVDEADCLGIGEKAPFPPVLLYLQIKSGYGEAKAVFYQEPSQAHYELLKAVGVKFLGGYQQGSHYVAQFQNRLPVHIHAGILAHFTRTGNCNLFFLQHGSIDPQLESGLLKASENRVAWARNLCFKAVAQLANEACHQPMAMTGYPPPPAEPFSLGDLVPLGFLLKALNLAASDSSISAARHSLSSLLLNKRQGHLWSFHTDYLTTSTDSVLVLQGFDAPEAVEALEIFADGRGGYYPQLWSQDKQAGKMVINDGNRHWCQPDYATTCLVRALRAEVGLTTKTTTEYLAAGFETRSGLYFVNPYIVDWALASALSKDESAVDLKHKLLAEILASMNDDYSFGNYDVAMSTAFAILSLAALGYRGRTIRLAQLRLLDFMEAQGTLPAATPFYSTLLIDDKLIPPNRLFKLLLSDHQKQILQINYQYHGISYYVDSERMIATAVAALALDEKCCPTNRDANLIHMTRRESHPRYQCRSHSEYIAKFALTPYLSADASKLCSAKAL